MTDLELRTTYPGAYLERDDSGVRLYCRSPVDAAHTLRMLRAQKKEDVTVYKGHVDPHAGEYDDEADARLLAVLNSPVHQRMMSLFDARLVGVTPDGKKPKLKRKKSR